MLAASFILIHTLNMHHHWVFYPDLSARNRGGKIQFMPSGGSRPGEERKTPNSVTVLTTPKEDREQKVPTGQLRAGWNQGGLPGGRGLSTQLRLGKEAQPLHLLHAYCTHALSWCPAYPKGSLIIEYFCVCAEGGMQ